MTLETGSLGATQARIDDELDRVSTELRDTLASSDAKIPAPNSNQWIRDMKSRAGIDPDLEELTALQATHLSQAMNEGILYGGLQFDASQVAELSKPFNEDAQEPFYKAYNAYYRRSLAGPLSGRIWPALGGVATITLVWAADARNWSGGAVAVAAGCVAMIAYAAVRVDRISSHWDGYFSGFSDGRREGTYVALGINSDADRRDVQERAQEMQRYGRTFPPA
ncbi:MAG TPA: hypothetical protein VNJ02_17760 [Vicinamibacterales bacterium]|nr:hypothetical protein [Vicinamibacterales bacterium]